MDYGRLGLPVGGGLLLMAAFFLVGCASTTPDYRPSIAGIKKVLLVGFPGKVYDDRNKGRRVLDLAETNLAMVSNFDIQVDPHPLRDLRLLQWGHEGEPCLTFKMLEVGESATVDVDRVIALAREKGVDAVMIGGLRLYPRSSEEPHLALNRRNLSSKDADILNDPESDVFIEAILVGADGSCRWHGRKETSLSISTGLKSMVTFGIGTQDEVAYDRIVRGLKYLFLLLPQPPRTD